MKRYIIQFLLLSFFFTLLLNSNKSGLNALEEFTTVNYPGPAIFKSDTAWVDSVLQSLNLEEKIGQLIMVDAYSRLGKEHEKNLLHLIKKYNIGGLVFFKGGPVRQAMLTNHLQKAAKIPLLISQDAELGLGWRLDSAIRYPRQMTLGAIEDESLIYQMGYDIGKQLRRIGVHINFAPVVDINNNPDNPVINSRSFGEDRMNVARKAVLYAQGLQDAGVLPVFKHFPGHGDTNMDSHHTLPLIDHDFDRLDSLELFPFKYGIEKGIPAIMSAHLHVPALDSSYRLAASLSPRILEDFLRNTLGFKGLLITDGLGMRGVSSFLKPGEIETMAFAAGNDILLMPSDVPEAISHLKKEIKRGNISEERLDESVRRILFTKAWVGIDKERYVQTDSIAEVINNPFYEVEKSKLIRNSITLLKNRASVIPFRNLESYNIASIAIGTGKPDSFSTTLKNYTEVDAYYLNKEVVVNQDASLLKKLDDYNTLIVSIHNTSQWPGRNYGIYPQTRDFLENLDFSGNLILVLFGNPYTLNKLGNIDKFNSIVVAYEDNPGFKYYTAQGIFGAFELKGRLPVSVQPDFELFRGLKSDFIQRLSYGFPEEVMMDSRKLMKIDSVVNEALEIKAIPGCQILVARKRKVVIKKNYGWQTYRRKQKVRDADLYDLASITKIAATLPSLMKLEGQGRFSTEDTLGYYLEMPDTSDKNGLLIRDILSHQSGLQSWIPFYYKTLEPLDTSQALLSSNFSWAYPYKIGLKAYANRNIIYTDSVYRDNYSPGFPFQVAKNMYLRKDFRDTIYNNILSSELGEKEYLYSDLGYYFFHQIIERITDTLLYPFVFHNFYAKLGAFRMGYLPLNRFGENDIIPTENDIIFRRQLLRGYVHDPGAAMLGGIAGHAGVFSNANDLAKVLQMYLNGGTYGGRKFIEKAVIDKYTRRVYSENGNRRALGFDKPEPDDKKIGPTSESATLASYGHTGFTGTMAWIDPEYDLIYIFLSNRIHPNQYNLKLIKEDIRTRVQEAIYEAIIN